MRVFAVHTAWPNIRPSNCMKKIALFADVQNLYYTVRQIHGCHFNYAALWAEVSQRGEIVEAYAYAIERGDSKQQQFQQILRNLGFIVKLKPYIQRSDGSAKGDWDVGITIDVLDVAARADEVVLASGDGDFDLLLERVRRSEERRVGQGRWSGWARWRRGQPGEDD